MLRKLLLAASVSLLTFACVPKKVPPQATSTIEEIENEPPPDAGAVAATPEKAEPPPAPSVTFVKYEATEGFSVSMPKDPQVQRASQALKKGSVNTVSVTSNVEGVIYSVTRAEYPEGMAKKKGAKKMLDEARDGLAKALAGSVNDQKDQDLAGHPGENFTVAGAKNMVRARTAMVKNELFNLIVVYTGKVPEKADEFLNSIELSNAPPAPAAAPAAK